MPDQILNTTVTIKRRTTASVDGLGENVYTYAAVYTNIPARLENWHPEYQYRDSGERPKTVTILYLKSIYTVLSQDQVYQGSTFIGSVQNVVTAISPAGGVDHYEARIENP